jgi:hypothetical protein
VDGGRVFAADATFETCQVQLQGLEEDVMRSWVLVPLKK